MEGNVIVRGRLTASNLFTDNDWKPYTPTVAGGTLPTNRTVNYFKWRLQGSTLYIRASVANTDATGAASSATYTFTLPTGCVLNAATAAMSCGAAFLQTVASGKKYTGNAVVNTTGTSPKFGLMLGNETSTPAAWGAASPHATDTDLNVVGGLIWSADFAVELDPTSPLLVQQPK